MSGLALYLAGQQTSLQMDSFHPSHGTAATRRSGQFIAPKADGKQDADCLGSFSAQHPNCGGEIGVRGADERHIASVLICVVQDVNRDIDVRLFFLVRPPPIATPNTAAVLFFKAAHNHVDADALQRTHE
jgi:hypothetical protein